MCVSLRADVFPAAAAAVVYRDELCKADARQVEFKKSKEMYSFKRSQELLDFRYIWRRDGGNLSFSPCCPC